MVIRELVSEISKNLTENAQFEARQIVMSASGLDNTSLLLKANEAVDDETIKKAYHFYRLKTRGKFNSELRM